MNNYTMEQLIPVVAELSRKYTSGESTSVSYDKANQLMGSVIYSIEEFERAQIQNNTLMTSDITPLQAFKIGQDSIVKRVKKLTLKYDLLTEYFKDYGNKNYHDTFFGGISGFLKYYDYRFNPQNSIITMDYPVLEMPLDCSGINAVEIYFHAISIEQQFLKKVPEDYVVTVLKINDSRYKTQFYNIGSIICRNLIGCMIAGKSPEDEALNEDYEKINDFIDNNNSERLCEKLSRILAVLVDKQFDGNQEILAYFNKDMKDFAVELINGKNNKSLKKVLTL